MTRRPLVDSPDFLTHVGGALRIGIMKILRKHPGREALRRLSAAPPPEPLTPYDRRTLPPVVTISALPGTGVDAVAPRVADRLGVPWYDGAVPADLAARAGLPPELVATVLDRRGRSRRRVLGPPEEPAAGTAPAGAVLVDPAGAVLFRAVPGALHVQLGGPWQRRISRIMAGEEVDRPTAEQRARSGDRDRASWLRRAFGVVADDPDLYHLCLDATAYSVDTCVDLIVSASNRRTGVTDLAPSWA